MRRSSVFRSLAIAALLMAVFRPFSPLHAQGEREGEVVEVRDGTVRVDLGSEGDGAPTAGDSVAIFDPTVPGLDPVPVRGTWVVSRAEGGSAWLEPVGSATSVLPGYLVRIFLSEARPQIEEPAGDVTVDGVLERYYDAVGGREAWSAVRSVRVRGTVEGEGSTPVSFEQVVARPYRLWGRMWSEEYTRTRGYDGESAWTVGERADGSPPSVRIVDHEGELALAKFEADLDGPLMGHDPADVEFELLRTEPVQGTEAYVIGVSTQSGLYHRVFVDADRFVVLKLVIPNPEDLDNDDDAWIQTYGDYRAVDGLLVAHVRQIMSPDSVKYVFNRV